MPKALFRIVALLLVPCLVADPAWAGSFHSFDGGMVQTSGVAEQFTQEAFANRVVYARLDWCEKLHSSLNRMTFSLLPKIGVGVVTAVQGHSSILILLQGFSNPNSHLIVWMCIPMIVLSLGFVISAWKETIRKNPSPMTPLGAYHLLSFYFFLGWGLAGITTLVRHWEIVNALPFARLGLVLTFIILAGLTDPPSHRRMPGKIRWIRRIIALGCLANAWFLWIGGIVPPTGFGLLGFLALSPHGNPGSGGTSPNVDTAVDPNTFFPGREISEREFQIIQAIVDEKTNKAIADSLDIGEEMAKRHLNQIFKKLEVSDRVQLYALAFDRGVRRNGTFLTPGQTTPAGPDNFFIECHITERELQMIEAILAQPQIGNKELSTKFRISEYTVKNHLRQIFDKLAVTSRLELYAIARRHRRSLVRESPDPTVELLPQELNILRGIVSEKTDADIAAGLGISRGNLRYRLRKIFEKLKVSTREELATLARQLNLSRRQDRGTMTVPGMNGFSRERTRKALDRLMEQDKVDIFDPAGKVVRETDADKAALTRMIEAGKVVFVDELDGQPIHKWILTSAQLTLPNTYMHGWQFFKENLPDQKRAAHLLRLLGEAEQLRITAGGDVEKWGRMARLRIIELFISPSYEKLDLLGDPRKHLDNHSDPTRSNNAEAQIRRLNTIHAIIVAYDDALTLGLNSALTHLSLFIAALPISQVVAISAIKVVYGLTLIPDTKDRSLLKLVYDQTKEDPLSPRVDEVMHFLHNFAYKEYVLTLDKTIRQSS